MTNKELFRLALAQSAEDLNCTPDDLAAQDNRLVFSAANDGARRYLKLPFDCDLVSYGGNVVASVSPALEEDVRRYLDLYPAGHSYRLFETPSIHLLSDILEPRGLKVCFMAEYFLPDVENLWAMDCSYRMRWLGAEDFRELYRPEWSNALCADRKHLDVLGLGAYDGEDLIGLAACSADCDTMWQIGVDVLSAYRRQGVASALTSRLALEILKLDRVPFYCAAWSNIRSVRNAIRCGFRPAWVELTAKSAAYVAELNQPEKGGAG